MPVWLLAAEASGDEPAPADRFLMVVAEFEWAARDYATSIARLDFEPAEMVVWLARGHHRVRCGPFPMTAGRELILEGLVNEAGLPSLEVSGPIPWVPSSMDRDLGWRPYWAYLLLDLAQYGWALREAPKRLMCRRLEVVDGGGVIVLESHGQRWITLIPLPPASDLVGMAFEIQEWVEATGRLVGDGVWAKQLDKYKPLSDEMDTWALEWLRSEGYEA